MSGKIKNLLAQFVDVTVNIIEDLESRVSALESENKIHREATKGPEIKAFYYCDAPDGDPGVPSNIELRGTLGDFKKQEVNFLDEMIAEDQIDLHGTRNIFEGRNDLVDEDLEIKYDDPICFKCSMSCSCCRRTKECKLQSRDHGDRGVAGFGLKSVCDSCTSNSRCYP
jgi:hypothetical protein